MRWQQLRLVCWYEICRVYLLVLWYEWWTIIYKFSYDTGIPIGTCQWILWISCQQHHHGEIRIRNKNCLFFLYATANQKGENKFLIYIYIEWTKRATSYEVEIPRRVSCSWIFCGIKYMYLLFGQGKILSTVHKKTVRLVLLQF